MSPLFSIKRGKREKNSENETEASKDDDSTYIN